jgi:hypothetical protein
MVRNCPFTKCSVFMLVLRWTTDSRHRHTHVQFHRHVNTARCKNLLNAGLSWPCDVTSPAGTCSCKKKDIFYLFTFLFYLLNFFYLFIHGLFKSSVSSSMSKWQTANHLVTSKLERLWRDAVRLQCDPVLMCDLKDCTAFYCRVQQSNSRHVGQNVCTDFVDVGSRWPEWVLGQ